LAGYRAHPMLHAPWDSLRIVKNNAQTSEELTYLKAQPGQKAALAEFIRRNWFAMDALAQNQGLIAEFELHTAPTNANQDWDLKVRVRYPHPGGYAAIASEFEAIRNAHQRVLIDGKGLPELGRYCAVSSSLVLNLQVNNRLADRVQLKLSRAVFF
jgi:hypothetical protein